MLCWGCFKVRNKMKSSIETLVFVTVSCSTEIFILRKFQTDFIFTKDTSFILGIFNIVFVLYPEFICCCAPTIISYSTRTLISMLWKRVLKDCARGKTSIHLQSPRIAKSNLLNYWITNQRKGSTKHSLCFQLVINEMGKNICYTSILFTDKGKSHETFLTY